MGDTVYWNKLGHEQLLVRSIVLAGLDFPLLLHQSVVLFRTRSLHVLFYRLSFINYFQCSLDLLNSKSFGAAGGVMAFGNFPPGTGIWGVVQQGWDYKRRLIGLHASASCHMGKEPSCREKVNMLQVPESHFQSDLCTSEPKSP